MELVKIKDVLILKNGFAFKSSDYQRSGIPLIRIKNIENGQITINDSTVYLPTDYNEKYKKFLLRTNDILVALSGASVGKFGLNFSSQQLLLNQRIGVIREKNNDILLNKYFYYLLHQVIHEIKYLSKGGAQPNISLREIGEKKIILPPIKFQKEVIDKFEKIQNLVTKRKQSIGLLDEYIRSVYVNMFGDPILNPNGIEKQRLDYFGNWSSGGTPPKKDKKYYTNGIIPWFSSGELNTVYIDNSNVLITEEAISDTSAKKIKKGSLLIGMYDTAALKTSIATIECSCNQAIAFSKIDKERGNAIFLLFSIQLAKNYFLNKRKGARQKNLSLSKIKELEIIAPSVEEQSNFETIFNIVNTQKRLLYKSQDLLEELFQALIYETFAKTNHKKDEVQTLLDDNFLLQKFFDKIDKSDFQSLEQYDIEVTKLRDVLVRTELNNKNNSNFKKGIVQVIKGNKVVLKINQDYINELFDEARET